MYRTSAIRAIGGYDDESSTSHVEDYDLWVRLVMERDYNTVRCIQTLPRIGLWHRKWGDHRQSDGDDYEDDGGMAGEERNCRQREGSLRISRNAMLRLIHYYCDDTDETAKVEGNNTRFPSSSNDEEGSITKNTATLERQIEVLKYPDNKSTFTGKPHAMESIDGAARLLNTLEECFCKRYTTGYIRGRGQRGGDGTLTCQEIAMIRSDCDARIGEMATLALDWFGKRVVVGGIGREDGVWSIWCRRCPGLQLERLALLCHCKQ